MELSSFHDHRADIAIAATTPPTTPDARLSTRPPATMSAPTPPLDLTALSPQALTPTGRLHGQITIKWPYSASTQKLTFLLADPDIRRRALGGQVKVTLAGGAAEFVDRIESGEEVSLTAGGKALEAVPETDTPRVKWHITFPHGCTITVHTQSPTQPPHTLTPRQKTRPLKSLALPKPPNPSSPRASPGSPPRRSRHRKACGKPR